MLLSFTCRSFSERGHCKHAIPYMPYKCMSKNNIYVEDKVIAYQEKKLVTINL